MTKTSTGNNQKNRVASDGEFFKKLNLFTLRFKDSVEDKFQDQYFTSSVPLIRISFLGGFFYYGAFAILDAINLPEFLPQLLLIRFGIVGPAILGIVLLSFTKGFKKWWQPGIAITTIIAGVAIAIMTTFPHDIARNSYYTGMILVLIYCYMLIRLRYLWSSFAGISIVATYAITLALEPDISRDIKLTNMFFLVAANILGMLAGYAIEFYTRKGFYYSYLLQLESEKVKKANRELDSKVRLKTIELERDLELRKKTEKELIIAKEKAEESDRLKSAFLANMSHEIRTPMNGIMGFANLLDNPEIDTEKVHKYTAIIKKSGNRMLDTINDLIDIARLEAGLVETDFSEENINTLLEDLLEFFQPEARNKGIKLILTKKLNPVEEMIRTDRDKFNSIATNLLKNAIKYTEKGVVEFGAQVEEQANGRHHVCYFRDTGIGIPAKIIDKIFDRFTREESDKTSLYEGSGLGLAITKSYVSMLGGEIEVHSEVGTGSEFRFSLPLSLMHE